MVYLITGKAGAGKTHYANELSKELTKDGHKVKHLDGDVLRKQTKNDDYSDIGRKNNLLCAAKETKHYEDKGCIVLLSFICPRKEWRDMMRKQWQESIVIYIPGGTLWEGSTYEKPSKEELRWQ